MERMTRFRAGLLLTLFFLLVGYVFGVVSKLVVGNISYVMIFYIINFCAISIDVALYFRNRKLDRLSEAAD